MPAEVPPARHERAIVANRLFRFGGRQGAAREGSDTIPRSLTLLVTWLAFPLLLAALGLGCGMLVERIAGVRVPGALLPAIGISFLIVVAQFPTLWDATAEATTPIVVVLALTGLALSPRLADRDVDW